MKQTNKIKMKLATKSKVISQGKSKLFGLIGLLVIFLLPLNVQARMTIPKPTEVFYVADYANVLTQETQDFIVVQNDALFANNGAQIVVATVDFLDGNEIEDYAHAMFNEWKIGDKNKNNGILLLLVIGEEDYWVVQGKGLENTLSSGTLKSILMKDMEPSFAIGEYNTGVLQTFQSLYDVIEGVYGPVDTSPTPGVWEERPTSGFESAIAMIGGFLMQLFVMVILLIVVVSFLRPRRYRRRWGPIFMPRPRYYRQTPRYRRPGPGPGPGFGGRTGGSSFGSGRSSGGFGSGSRPSGGSRSGGGGSSRGGGAGRH